MENRNFNEELDTMIDDAICDAPHFDFTEEPGRIIIEFDSPAEVAKRLYDYGYRKTVPSPTYTLQNHIARIRADEAAALILEKLRRITSYCDTCRRRKMVKNCDKCLEVQLASELRFDYTEDFENDEI